MKEQIIEILKQEAEAMTQKSKEAFGKYYNLDDNKLMEESDRIASEYRENVADKILNHLTAEQGKPPRKKKLSATSQKILDEVRLSPELTVREVVEWCKDNDAIFEVLRGHIYCSKNEFSLPKTLDELTKIIRG